MGGANAGRRISAADHTRCSACGITALVWRWAHGGVIGGKHTLQCMVNLATERATVRRTLVEAIERYDVHSDPGTYDFGMIHAADVLGRLDDGSSTDTLAERIMTILSSAYRNHIDDLTRALARLTLKTHARTGKARRTLATVALGEHDLGRWCASAGMRARIDAVRALADYQDEAARKVLETVAAREPCVRTAVVWNDDIDSVTQASCPEEVACWAAAALAREK